MSGVEESKWVRRRVSEWGGELVSGEEESKWVVEEESKWVVEEESKWVVEVSGPNFPDSLILFNIDVPIPSSSIIRLGLLNSLSLSLSLHFLNFTLSTAAYTLRDTVCAVNTQALIKLSHSPYRHMYSYLRQLVTHSLGNHYLKLSFDNLPDLRQKSRLFSWGWGGGWFQPPPRPFAPSGFPVAVNTCPLPRNTCSPCTDLQQPRKNIFIQNLSVPELDDQAESVINATLQLHYTMEPEEHQFAENNFV